MNKESILGIIRHVLTFAGGIIVTKGLADDADITAVIGGLITVTGAVWSILSKRAALKLPTVLLFFVLLPSAFMLSGCGATLGTVNTGVNSGGDIVASTDLTINTNLVVVGSGSYNPATGTWSAGISIVFKDEIAAAQAAAELSLHNLAPKPYTRTGTVWTLAKFDKRNPDHLTVIEVALKNGATISGL